MLKIHVHTGEMLARTLKDACESKLLGFEDWAFRHNRLVCPVPPVFADGL